MSVWIPDALVRRVRQRAGNRCEYCLLPQATQEAKFHIDHVFPVKHGGKSSLDNLALSCVTCSLRKGARILVPDPITKRRVTVYNPRKHPWHDHFEWTQSWKILGKTSIGRATLVALGMNRVSVVAIRRAWAVLGEFP
jgi:5-methylcytosine-specific restriction endonuclease McrA